MLRRLWIVALAVMAAGALGLSRAPRAGEPLTLTTMEQENKLGEDAYREILQKEKVVTDPLLVQYVRQVVQRVTAVAPEKGFKYEFSLLDSPQCNAFCLPGGKICVYTGILPYCQNEAGLATVVGHEVAHAVLRHAGQRMTQGAVVDVLGAGLGKVLEATKVSGTTGTIAMGAYDLGSKLGILLPYSRSHEVEADEAGVMYLARAGYDPREAPRFWGRFSTVASDVPSFLSTHPAHEDRAQRLEQVMKDALKLYSQAKPQYGLGEFVALDRVKALDAARPVAKTAAPTTAPVTTSTPTTKTTTSTTPPATTSTTPTPKTTAPATPRSILSSIPLGDLGRGIQEALSQGFKHALQLLGKKDGFFGDALVKIVAPKEVSQLAQLLRTLGKGDMVDQFELQMNRAAEQAVPATAEILGQAVAGLTFADVQTLLQGPQDAATRYFERTCGADLKQRILPIVTQATAKAGATSAFKNMVKKAGFAGRLLLGDFDLDSYVADKALGGLYVKMADEERRIRENPGGQASDLLRKVFSSVLGK